MIRLVALEPQVPAEARDELVAAAQTVVSIDDDARNTCPCLRWSRRRRHPDQPDLADDPDAARAALLGSPGVSGSGDRDPGGPELTIPTELPTDLPTLLPTADPTGDPTGVPDHRPAADRSAADRHEEASAADSTADPPPDGAADDPPDPADDPADRADDPAHAAGPDHLAAEPARPGDLTAPVPAARRTGRRPQLTQPEPAPLRRAGAATGETNAQPKTDSRCMSRV